MGDILNPLREKLIATVAILMKPWSEGFDVNAAWKSGEEYVAALEREPDKPAKCPCCKEQVVLCLKHYLLHEQGKLCSGCRGDE
jgi:hypothetical protein